MKIHLFTAPKAYTIIFIAAVIFPVFSFICSDLEKTLSASVLMADIKNSLSGNSDSQIPAVSKEANNIPFEF